MVQDVINVVKRGDRGREPLNIDKIHDMVEYAVEDIKGVSSSQVEMQSGLQFYDGMSTDEIQQILIKSAADLISLENPNDFFNVVKNKSNIRHIITGHVHITSTTIKNNIPQTTIGGSHFTHSVKNFFTPFNYNLNELKNMKDENKISREMIDEMSKQYENIVIL